MEVKVFFF